MITARLTMSVSVFFAVLMVLLLFSGFTLETAVAALVANIWMATSFLLYNAELNYRRTERAIDEVYFSLKLIEQKVAGL